MTRGLERYQIVCKGTTMELQTEFETKISQARTVWLTEHASGHLAPLQQLSALSHLLRKYPFLTATLRTSHIFPLSTRPKVSAFQSHHIPSTWSPGIPTLIYRIQYVLEICQHTFRVAILPSAFLSALASCQSCRSSRSSPSVHHSFPLALSKAKCPLSSIKSRYHHQRLYLYYLLFN